MSNIISTEALGLNEWFHYKYYTNSMSKFFRINVDPLSTIPISSELFVRIRTYSLLESVSANFSA